jgi:hypothetical protein
MELAWNTAKHIVGTPKVFNTLFNFSTKEETATTNAGEIFIK